MAAIKDWVRGLVMLVVLASVLELLLPMNSMKRFVRMAMGLLIVLGVVRPIVGLLGQSLTVDPTLLLSPDEGLPSMHQIMAEADRFQARNQALAIKEAEERLRAIARSAAKGVEGVAEAEVALQLRQGKSQEEVQVEGATVTLLLGSRFGQVRPVEPVGEEPRSGAAPPLPGEATLAAEVRRAVAAQLGMGDPTLIQVLIERPGQPRR